MKVMQFTEYIDQSQVTFDQTQSCIAEERVAAQKHG
jgi:hypothetical protein